MTGHEANHKGSYEGDVTRPRSPTPCRFRAVLARRSRLRARAAFDFPVCPGPLERGRRGRREGSRERWRTLYDWDGAGRGGGAPGAGLATRVQRLDRAHLLLAFHREFCSCPTSLCTQTPRDATHPSCEKNCISSVLMSGHF